MVEWKWYVGNIPGLGDCVWMMPTEYAVNREFKHMSHVARTQTGRIVLVKWTPASEGMLQTEGTINLAHLAFYAEATPKAAEEAEKLWSETNSNGGIIPPSPDEVRKFSA